MLGKLLTIASVVVLLGLGFAFSARASVSSGPTTLSPGITLRVQGANAGTLVEPWQLGREAADRARAVAQSGAPILPRSLIGGYTPDSAGLIGYAWQLPVTPPEDFGEWSTRLRNEYAVEVPILMLEAGDILINARSGVYGHALVFDRWLDEAGSGPGSITDPARAQTAFERGVRFVGHEIDPLGDPPRAVTRTHTLVYRSGGLTIGEWEAHRPGPYYPLRSNRIPGYAATLAGVRISEAPAVGAPVMASFVLVNRGGVAVRLRHVAAAGYGPSALQQGIAGSRLPWPERNDIMLAPGQTFTYRAVVTLSQPGTYLVLPQFEVDGALNLPLEPTYFQVRPR